MPAPLPSFLQVDGNPDPGAWGPRGHEAHRGSDRHPGTGSPLESSSSHNVSTPPPPVTSLAPDTGGTPAPGGSGNYPAPNMGGLDFLAVNRTLAPSNTQTPPAPAPFYSELFEVPRLEDDPGWYRLSPLQQRFLNALSRHQSVTAAAKSIGVKRSAMYAVRRRNEDFKQFWELAIADRGDMLEDEALRRAVKGVEEPVFYMGAVCGYKRVYSDSLLTRLLEGHKPEKYRTNHQVDVSGTLGIATLVLPATTSAEEWMKQNNGTIIDQLPENEYD